MGPAPDQPHFLAVVRQARAHHPALAGVLADAGYDGERYQKYLYERLGVLGVVMPKTGLPPPPTTKTTRRRRAGPEPKAFYRRFLYGHWPRHLYARRAQAEARVSMGKRLFGAHLTARTHHGRRRQIRLRSITLNLMINAAAAPP